MSKIKIHSDDEKCLMKRLGIKAGGLGTFHRKPGGYHPGVRNTGFERINYRVEMYIKSAVKFPVEIVEVTGLPDLGGLVASVLKAKASDRILYDEPPLSSVYFKAVAVLVSV